MTRRLIVGLSGASGVLYGIRTLLHLRGMGGVETHLIVTEAARAILRVESDFDLEAVEALADVVHRPDNLAASLSSGSFRTDGMIVAPCSIKTLSGITNSYTDTLMTRAADVVLKEKRKLVLMVRETPLHQGHLELMARAAGLGAMILPPVPAFYHGPKTIEDLVDHAVGKAFDYFGLEHDLFSRWGEPRRSPRPAAR